jgi:hypothetical protein
MSNQRALEKCQLPGKFCFDLRMQHDARCVIVIGLTDIAHGFLFASYDWTSFQPFDVCRFDLETTMHRYTESGGCDVFHFATLTARMICVSQLLVRMQQFPPTLDGAVSFLIYAASFACVLWS